MTHRFATLFITLVSLFLCGRAGAQPELRQELLFPLQGQHVHSSSVVECPDGSLLVCWFQGSGERWADDVAVMGARLKKDAREWSTPFVMADIPGFPDCNPVLFIDAEERLWLFWAHVLANRWEHSLLKYRRADDYQGEGPPDWNWQDVITLKPGEDLPDQLRAGFKALGYEQSCWAEFAHAYDDMIVEAARDSIKRQKGWMPRNHVTVLPSGRLLLPLYSDGFNLSLIALSDDMGANWRASGPIIGLGPTQPSIVRKNDGSLVAYLRDEGELPPRAMTSVSTDEGETWSPSVDTKIPNPSSSLEVVRLQNGHWLMICNDTEDSRARLVVSLSEDEGASWTRTRVVEEKAGGSFSYPSMIQARDGTVHITYSYRPEDGSAAIKHVAFEEGWVKEK